MYIRILGSRHYIFTVLTYQTGEVVGVRVVDCSVCVEQVHVVSASLTGEMYTGQVTAS